MSKTRTETYVAECPECGRFYTARGISTHIKNHRKKNSGAKSYEVPHGGNTDVDELSEMDFGSDDEVNVLGMDFTALSISSPNTAAVDLVPVSQQKEKKKRLQPEQAIQLKMEKKLGGGHKVLPIGIVDVYTDDTICEVKCWENWKHGIGQLVCYQYYHPKHMLHLHLFGKIPPEEKKIPILTICAHLRIKVTWEK